MPSVQIADKTKRLNGHARALGCPELLLFDSEPSVSHLEYLDLVHGKGLRAHLLPDAVAEFQGRPLLYLVDGVDGRATPQGIADLQRLLANRGEHACLGIVKPGSLDIFPINLDQKALAKANFLTVQISDGDSLTFFQALATGAYELPGRPTQADYVFETIHRLLAEASKELAGTDSQEGPLPGLDVLSTTGRALFFRFLVDRRIVLEGELQEICPEASDLRDTFSTSDKAAATSCWLDETFNGDLLPLGKSLASDVSPADRLRAYRKYYRSAGEKTEQRLFLHLQAILKGWKHVGASSFQATFDIDWDDFNFAHIPIGVLSQVYESFSHQWDEDHAEKTSVYYTPRQIAKILVDEAFAGVANPADAVVLDPACGAGVFLVLAFRQLVREYWKKHGSRPNTRAIQRILYKQLRGFEVSESALRLSALGLYISAIEVNGTQRPPASLKFPRPLRDEVLFDFGTHGKERKHGFVLGSLGPNVPKSFDGSFDVVVTNPPWTRLRSEAEDGQTKTMEKKFIADMNAEFTAITRRTLNARGLHDLARGYANPDNNPDLPFLWRATEWAKPGGIIAMALPGRIILKQGGKGKAARDAILSGLTVTGILNGSDLEKTAVWPNMDLPFLLLFGRNSLPQPEHHFHFVTPVRENRLSSLGKFRLDYKSAETVSAQEVLERPWLLKALAVGTVLDVDVVEKLPRETLGSVWSANSLYSGEGYNLSPGLEQRPADHLVNLPDFEIPKDSFAIAFGQLPTWRERHDRGTAHSPRNERLYQPPLVVVPQAPRESRSDPKAFISFQSPMAFSKSHYGFSASGTIDSEILAGTLYLVVHSLLFKHFCLMKSSRQGASFRTIFKEDLDAFPFPDPRKLGRVRQERILELARSLETQNAKPWDEIDRLVFEIYGLDEHDATVVHDTVTYCGPYRSVRDRAAHPLTADDLKIFCHYLEDMLQPLFHVTGQKVAVNPVPLDSTWGFPPWHFVSVACAGRQPNGWKALLARLMKEANSTGASRIMVRVPNGGGLLIGILNQRRFWTRSRAWLCSLHIEEHHLDAFPVDTR